MTIENETEIEMKNMKNMADIDLLPNNNEREKENIKSRKKTVLYFFGFLVLTSLYALFTIYYADKYQYDTIVSSPYIYSEPNRLNSTFYFTPCFLDSLQNITNYKYYDNGLKFYYFDNEYCLSNTNIYDAVDVIESINNINYVMNNTLYYQQNVYSSLETGQIVLFLYIFIMTIIFIIMINKNDQLKNAKTVFLGQLLFVLLVSFLCFQYEFREYDNFTYINEYSMFVQQGCLLEIVFAYLLYLVLVLLVHTTINNY